VVLGGVPGDPVERDRMVEDKMGEEAPVLVAARRIIRKVEPVPLEILPEQLGRQRMVRCPILSTTVGALEGPSDRIARFSVAELHGRPRDAGMYLAEVHGGETYGEAPTDGSMVTNPSERSGSEEVSTENARGPR